MNSKSLLLREPTLLASTAKNNGETIVTCLTVELRTSFGRKLRNEHDQDPDLLEAFNKSSFIATHFSHPNYHTIVLRLY
jgi:hypothetical protein